MPRSFWLTKTLVRTGIARWLPSFRRRLDGGASYLRYLSDRCLASPIDSLTDLAAYWQADAADAIDLAGLAPRLELPPPASRAGSTRGYPPPGGLPDLRAAIADHVAGGKLTVNPADEVLVTAGATGAFAVALDTFVNPGDQVVTFAPTSPLFRIGLEHRRARVHSVPATNDGGIVRFPMETFTRALPRTKLLVLSHPANPTGGVFAPEDLEQLTWWANKFDVLIYCDESFARFRFDGEHVSVGSLKPATQRTLTAGSATFACGLAAARIGWLAGYRHLVRPCAVTAALLCPFIPAAGQLAAISALRQPAAVRETFAAKRRYVHERLTDLGLEPAWPAGGLCVWLPVGSLGLTGRAFADRLYAEKRVLVTPGDLCGPGGEDHVRVSFAADDGRVRAGLSRLVEFVNELRPAATTAAAKQVVEETPVEVG
jgi:aminotransferase